MSDIMIPGDYHTMFHDKYELIWPLQHFCIIIKGVVCSVVTEIQSPLHNTVN